MSRLILNAYIKLAFAHGFALDNDSFQYNQSRNDSFQCISENSLNESLIHLENQF